MSSFDALFSLAIAERIGMHNTDIETLDLLNVLGPMTAGQLSELTGLTSGATTRLIDRLETSGYARRVPDEHDRRRVIIEPVAENLDDVAALYAPLIQKLRAIWSRFTDEELEVVLRFATETNAGVAEVNTKLRAESSTVLRTNLRTELDVGRWLQGLHERFSDHPHQ
jgi:DNA-binding MarR family transcriptional regulator